MSFIVDNNLTVDEYYEGDWHIKKYANGQVELTAWIEKTITNYAGQFGGAWYPYVFDLELPITVYDPIPNWNVQIGGGYGFAQGTGNIVKGPRDHISCYAMSGSSGTQNSKCYVIIKGRWKE